MTNFYRAFEDKFRGNLELIYSRLKFYEPLVKELVQHYPDMKAVDLGCGRGEWLDVLSQFSIDSLGVDSDSGMLSACEERGLNIKNQDLMAFLESTETGTYSLVTAFHVVEHLPFDTLREMVDHCFRLLKPGGLLIFETPNAENIIVGTSNFHLDPTHIKPLPGLLLQFMVEYAGFDQTHFIGLQHSEELLEKSNFGLMDVIKGVSPDYAIVARKFDENVITPKIDTFFKSQYGYRLPQLTQHYDQLLKLRECAIIDKLDQYQLKTQQVLAEDRENLQQIQNSLKEFHSESQKLRSRNHDLSRELQEMHCSKSWRITAPLRKSMFIMQKIARFSKRELLIAYDKVLFSAWSRKVYRSMVARLPPNIADKLTGYATAIKIAIMKRHQTDMSRKIGQFITVGEKNYFDVVRDANIFNDFSVDPYLQAMREMILDSGMVHYHADSLPEGTMEWVVKIMEAHYNGGSAEPLLSEKHCDLAIAAALYIVLLKRIPENRSQLEVPVITLYRSILNSAEYQERGSKNLMRWATL